MGSGAWGDAVATISGGTVLDHDIPSPQLGTPPGGAPEPGAAGSDPVRGVELRAVRVRIRDLDLPPADVGDAYLRLHLLSHRLVAPNGINLDGIFTVLPTVCWTSLGPVDPATLPDVRARARGRGVHLEVRAVDKFPRMVDYVVPSGVRIADGDRVRLGAHLAEGTTVMH
jgi:2,3,4,5-tetrahydropyridine-2-carboxylate N-succinyltransferase